MGSKFNLWYLMIPVFVATAFLFGTTKYRVGKKWQIVSTSKGDTLLSVVATIFSATIDIMIVVESLRGVVQVISDVLLERDWGWLPILMSGAMITSYFICWALFFYSGKLGEVAMRYLIKFLLRRRRAQMRQKRQEEFLPVHIK